MQKIIKNSILIITFLFLILGIYLIHDSKKNNKEFFLFGYKPYIITTTSMEPYLKENSLIIIKKGGYDNVKISDKIMFKNPGSTINTCQEVISVTENGLVTKEINNQSADLNIITKDIYIGKLVFKTSIFRGYTSFINDNGIFLGFIIPIIILTSIIATIRIMLSRRVNDDFFIEEEPLSEEDIKVIKEKEQKEKKQDEIKIIDTKDIKREEKTKKEKTDIKNAVKELKFKAEEEDFFTKNIFNKKAKKLSIINDLEIDKEEKKKKKSTKKDK